MTLRRSLVISEPAHIKKICRSGSKINTKYFRTCFIPDQNPGQFLVIIPKKKAKKAVTRNLVRRWLYNDYRQRREVIKNLSIVSFIRFIDPSLPRQEFRRAVLKDFDKLINLLSES